MDKYAESDVFSNESDEENFIRDNLSFLVEADDDSDETISFICREAEVCVYRTSTIDTSVKESWSVLSRGSLTSTKAKPSKSSKPAINLQELAEESASEPRSSFDLSFLKKSLEGQTSTPIKHFGIYEETPEGTFESLGFIKKEFTEDSSSSKFYVKEEKSLDSTHDSLDFSYNLMDQVRGQAFADSQLPLDLSYNILDLSFTTKEATNADLPELENWIQDAPLDLSYKTSDTSWSRHFNDQAISVTSSIEKKDDQSKDLRGACSLLRHPREAPIQKLNKSLKLNKSVIYETIEEEDKAKSGSSEVKNGCAGKVSSKVYKSESLVLPDLIQREVEEPKPIDVPKTDYEENKENWVCNFCFKNGELPKVYASHVTKKPDGTVVCPILRKYVCDLCGETGDKAHTRKYCRFNNVRFARKPYYRRLSNGVLTTCHNHK